MDGALPVERPSGRLRLFAKGLAVLTFAVTVAGGIVTSTDSGLADAHWPSFEGNLLPSFSTMLADRGLLFEHGHRIIAGLAVVFTIVQAFWVARAERRRWVRRVAAFAAFLAPVPAVFGGLTVLYELPPAMSIVHVSVAMLLLGSNVLVAVVLGRVWEAGSLVGLEKDEARAGLRGLAGMAAFLAAAVYLQILLGAVPRHAYVGAVPHILWAFVVCTVAILAGGRVLGRYSRVAGLLNPASGLFALAVVQMFLGFATFLTRPDAVGAPATGMHEVLTSSHQAAGVLMWVAAVILAARSLRSRRLASALEDAAR